MGLLFSGAVASLSFYHRVEKKFIDTDILSSSGVIAYQRYHDDIVCAYENSAKFFGFVHQVKLHSAHFKVVCSQSSASKVDYLDLSVCISQSRIHTSPALKKIVIPLAPESGHTSAVHTAWPRAVALRYLILSGGKSNKSATAEYYRNNNSAPGTLRVLDRTLFPVCPVTVTPPRLSG